MGLRYRYVLFDLDGTLVDSAEGVVASVRHALAQLVPGREPPDNDTILMQVGKPLEMILAQLGYPADPAAGQRFADTYRRHYAEHGVRGLKPYPGVDETLAGLKAANVRVAVVTTKQQQQADLTVAAAGIGRHLDLVRGWQEGKKHKPDPEPFLDALACLEAKPQMTTDKYRYSSIQSPESKIPNLRSALVIGDTEQDILAAQSAGIDCCAVTYGFRPAMMLLGLRPDYMVGHIIDVLSIVLRPLEPAEA